MKSLEEKIKEAKEKYKARYVVCIEGKHEDVLTLYKVMSIEEELNIALGNGKMYIICENNEQATGVANLLNHEDELYAYLV